MRHSRADPTEPEGATSDGVALSTIHERVTYSTDGTLGIRAARTADPPPRPYATLKWIVVVSIIVIGVVVGSYLLINQLGGGSDFCSYATRGADCPTVTSTTP